MAETLTGKTRYRTGLFGRLILQVQEIRVISDWRTCEDDRFTAWRDARVEDLSALSPAQPTGGQS